MALKQQITKSLYELQEVDALKCYFFTLFNDVKNNVFTRRHRVM